MRVRHLASLAAGLLVAFAVAGLPASAADQSIDAVSNTGWDNPDRTINVNDSVTWTNGTIYDHNVCVRRTNVSSGCGEFQEPPTPTHPWPNPVTHQFQSDGTFKYYCQRHPAMTGTITVGSGVNPPVSKHFSVGPLDEGRPL
jgi:plastocyanin